MTKFMFSSFIIVLTICFFNTGATFAQDEMEDVVYFEDGAVVRGKILELNTTRVIIETKGGHKIERSFKEVHTISEEKVKAEVPYVDKTKPIVSKHRSGSTYAQENNKTSAEEFGKYIGIGIGQSSLDVSDSGADSIDDTDTSLKIFVGADINPNFAVEFGYIDFGEFSAHYPLYDETDCAKGSALFAAAIGQANITEQFSLFGKLGFAYWNVDFTADATILGTPVSVSGDGTGIDLLYGIGINFKATDQISIRAEWEQYKDVADGVDVTIPGYGSFELDGEDVDVLGVALIYNF